MGPLTDEEGNALGPELYDAIVQERYLISKRSNISYQDTGTMSVHERKLLLKFISQEIEQEQKAMAELNNKKLRQF